MKRGLAIAIDFGGTKTLVGIVDAGGNVLASRRFATDAAATPEAHFARCVELAEACLREFGGDVLGNVLGVGMTVPGLAAPESGVLIHAPFLGWRDVPAVKMLGRHWPELPAYIANDVNACAIGEMFFGVSGQFRNMLWVTVSTGIGGGMIVDGRIYEGEHRIAGEVGHVVVEWERPLPCGCGNLGCLEAHASGTAIGRAAERYVADHPQSELAAYFLGRGEVVTAEAISSEGKGGKLNPVTAEMVARAAKDGVREAVEMYRQAGVYLGRALSSAVNLLNPGVVVMGGGVSQSWELLESAMRETIGRSVIGDENKQIPIVVTALGYEAGLKGAAALVFTNGGARRGDDIFHLL